MEPNEMTDDELCSNMERIAADKEGEWYSLSELLREAAKRIRQKHYVKQSK